MVAERVQQERAEQRRLEREEWKAQVEVERLTQEIEEVERNQRELKEVELERLTQEKEQLEEEKRVEQQRIVTLHGSERVAEQRQAALVASPPEAGLSRPPHQKQSGLQRGWTGGWGSLSLRKIARVVLCGDTVSVGPRGAHMELSTMSTPQKTMSEV